MEPFRHVTGVRALGRYVVELVFEGVERRIVDLEPVLDGPAFNELLDDYDVFRQVQADPDTATIVWPNGADLSPRTLYARSQPSVLRVALGSQRVKMSPSVPAPSARHHNHSGVTQPQAGGSATFMVGSERSRHAPFKPRTTSS